MAEQQVEGRVGRQVWPSCRDSCLGEGLGWVLRGHKTFLAGSGVASLAAVWGAGGGEGLWP